MAWQDRHYNREGGGSGPRFIFPMPSQLTFGLIIACVILFFVERLTGSFGTKVGLYGMLTFNDAQAFTQPWRWITYQYLHGSGGHLFWNILSIYFFVPPLERMWGWRRTLGFYTAGGIVAGVTFGIMNLFIPTFGLVGASGCIFAVLGALAALMPGMQVLAMLVIPITMRTIALLYTVFFIFSVVGDRDPSDAAHLGGLAFGYFAARYALSRLNPWERSTDDDAEPDFSSRDDTFRPRRRSRWASRRAVKLARAEREEQQRIDQILAKVSAHGMHSLTWFERRALKKATEHQRERDAQMSNLRRD